MKNIYLERYAWPDPVLPSYRDFAETGMVVVIPAYNETDLHGALNALNSCHPPAVKVLVLVVVNEPENAPGEIHATNQRTYREAVNFEAWFEIRAVHMQLAAKKAGVGLARKIGMDEAIRIFNDNQKNGIIICFDADCTCEPNYFLAIENFYSDLGNNLGLVYYEHPLNGNHPAEIIRYELFLRYYINALRYARYPNAVQTLGSCITVRSRAYEKQGGMNSRKAGEDFYFIHKMVPLGKIGEINSTCVYPSDRVSDRVPFGTGHAINKYLHQSLSDYETYNPKTFQDLKVAFSSYQNLFNAGATEISNFPASIISFYHETSFEGDLKKILKQSNSLPSFKKRFFAWWDGFRVLKFVHFSRDHYYPNVPLNDATDWLIRVHFQSSLNNSAIRDKLLYLRKEDRKKDFYIK